MDAQTTRLTPPGTAPGLLTGRVIDGEETLHFTLVEYDQKKCDVFYEVPIDECRFHLASPDKTWIDVSGRPSADMLQTLGTAFNLHPLALEDVFHGNQRSKIEIFDQQMFVVLNDPSWQDGELTNRQVSIFFGANYVISFHDNRDDLFKPIRERVQQAGARLRTHGMDYLVYALIDLVIDRKFLLLERIGDTLEKLEDETIEKTDREIYMRIHAMRRILAVLHRNQWAERETVHALVRPDIPFIKPETRTYMRDCMDHTTSIQDMIETYRDTANSMMELYLMGSSKQLNEVMKFLAIITTVFMPLTFIAGIYGMNFEPGAGPLSMPELGWEYGYVAVLGAMASIVVAMLIWFRRRGWF